MADPKRELEAFHFTPEFVVSHDPEFPGNGQWGCPVFGFGRDGKPQEPFESRWGTPVVIEVVSTERERWIGQFAAGGLGGVSGLFATPRNRALCVVADGLAYLLDVDNAGSGAQIVQDQVEQVEAVGVADLLLLVRSTDIVAIGANGVEWRSSRLAVDELRVLSSSGGVITCSVYKLGGTSTITISVTTGDQLDGTRLDSFWPPDALA